MYHFTGCFDKKRDTAGILPLLPPGTESRGNIATGPEVHFCPCEEYEIVCFGDIYNLPELQSRYGIHTDHRCRAIHDLFILKGNEWPKLADGEFTVIMQNENEMYIWRDRHGAGPQVYYTSAYFSSHLANLRHFGGFVAEPDEKNIATFLGIGYIPSPCTALKGVNKLPAGHMLYRSGNATKIQNLYNFENFVSHTATFKGSIEDATHQYDSLLRQAISTRIRGKSNIGLLLSGGYDSGGNIYTLRQVFDGDAAAFSIGFKDNPWTEVPLAKIMADGFHTAFHSYEINGEEIEALPQIVRHLGDPFQEGGLMVNFMAMDISSKFHPGIILGGDGNDQHFGTSGKEVAINWKLQNLGLRWMQKTIAAAGRHPAFDKQSSLFRVRFHNEKILHIIESDCFGFPMNRAAEIVPGITGSQRYDYLQNFPKSYKSFDHFYFARNYLIDIEQVINEVILFKASKIADLFGNQITFPYMSTDIYNFLQTLPREFKCKGTPTEIAKGKGVAKFLHKNLLKPVLPKEITHRKKQGGFAPLPLFFKDEARRRVLMDIIRKSGFYTDFANKAIIENFFREYELKAIDETQWFWYRQLSAFKFFNLLVMALWWEIHLNGAQGNHIRDFSS